MSSSSTLSNLIESSSRKSSRVSLRQRLVFIEQAFVSLCILLYSGGPINVILSGGFSQGDTRIVQPDYSLTRNLFLVTYLIISFLLFIRWKRFIRALPYGIPIWLLVGFACLSYFWSFDPGETLSTSIGLIGTTLFGIYFATRYTPKQQLQLLGWGFGLIIVLSFIYAILLPKYGIMGGVHAGAWRGVYTHKNTLGKIMTLSGMIFTLLAVADRKNRVTLCTFLFLSILLILFSNSTAALLNLGILLLTTVVCYFLRTNYRLMVVMFGSFLLISATATVAAVFNYETIIVDILGEDLTLTGRTSIWSSAMEVIKQRPWIGYGYEGFWDGMNGPSAYIWREVMWMVPDAHNGFVQLVLHLGLIGLGIFIVGYVINFMRSIYKIHTTSGVAYIWPMVYLTYVLISNIAEVAFLGRNTILWVLYVAVSLSIFFPYSNESERIKSSSNTS